MKRDYPTVDLDLPIYGATVTKHNWGTPLVQYGGGAVTLGGVALMLLVGTWVGVAAWLAGAFLIVWPLFWKVNREPSDTTATPGQERRADALTTRAPEVTSQHDPGRATRRWLNQLTFVLSHIADEPEPRAKP